jgi:hypothetical protein
MQYEHHCRTCDLYWLEEYPLEQFDNNRYLSCPECESEDTHRCVTDSAAIHFVGPGWSPDGYYKSQALDKYKKTGIKVYDRKEDHDREVAGQTREAELRRLKIENEVAKKTMGPDAAITQEEADRRIAKKVKTRVEG